MENDKKRLVKLEEELLKGKIKLLIGPTGAIEFRGWETKDRDGVSDVCAYRTLRASSSWALRQAVAKAEATQGKKINEAAIAAGHHAHGGTWHGGH